MTETPHIIIRMRHKDGSENFASFQLGTVRIGKAPENDLVIEDPSGDRSHAILIARENEFEIIALARPSGIRVDRQIVDRAILKQEQEFAINGTVFRPSLNGKEFHAAASLPTAEEPTHREAQSIPDWDQIEKVLQHGDELKPEEVVADPEPPAVEVSSETLPLPSDDEEEDAEDQVPAYSVRERVFEQALKASRSHAAVAFKVTRLRGELIHEVTWLTSGRQLREVNGRKPILRITRDRKVEVAAIPELDVAAGPDFNQFSPVAPESRPSRRTSWLPLTSETLVVRYDGIEYLIHPDTPETLRIRHQKTEVDKTTVNIFGAATWIHIVVVGILSIFSSPITDVRAARLPSAELEKFVDVALQDLKKPAVTEPVEEKVVKREEPKEKPKKETRKAPTKVAKQVASPRRAGPTEGKIADLSQVGALGKLGGTGLFSPTKMSTRGLVAAASNLDAVRAAGGVQTFRVGNLLKAMPGKEVRLASVSSSKALAGGTPKGDGFGNASVGTKQDRQVSGYVVDINPPPLSVSIQGGLTREEIARVVQENLSAIRYCYEKSLLDDPELGGQVVLKWSISSVGLVTATGIGSSTLKNANVHRCLVGEVRDWKFPKPRDGGIVLVSYPFVFKNATF
ncbi:MAG: AgmX/PglI C-terminal domain-containing protein [Pseudomonadota bacterium]